MSKLDPEVFSLWYELESLKIHSEKNMKTYFYDNGTMVESQNGKGEWSLTCDVKDLLTRVLPYMKHIENNFKYPCFCSLEENGSSSCSCGLFQLKDEIETLLR